MSELRIEPTQKTPFVHFIEGSLLIEGRSISEDPRNFYTSSILWIRNYVKQLPAQTDVDVKLEYSDTKSIKMIFEILQVLVNAARKNKDCEISLNWHYERGDGEMVEQGEVLESELGAEFNFIEYK